MQNGHKSTPEMRGFRVSDLGDAYAEVQAKGLEAGDIGNSFDAHGIAKGMMGTQVDALLNLLGNGIDQNKDFYTAPFTLKEEDRTAGAGVGIGTATNGA